MSVIVFHSSVAPFVQQAARAVDEAGQLDRFITTVHHRPDALGQRFCCTIARLAGLDLAAQFRRRQITEIPLQKVQAHPAGELLRLLVGKADRDGRATDMVWQRVEQGFDRRVAREVHRGLSGVYGFEYGALATFRRARDQGLAIAYEVPAVEPRFVQALLAAETARFPQLRTAYHRHTAARENERTARREAEWALADVILVNSTFTASTYEAGGRDCSRVRVVNLGAPPPAPELATVTARPDGRLRLLWAGKFGLLKGAHYLLEAWRQGGFGRHAQLDVFGRIILPPEMVHPVPEGICFRGTVPRDELLEAYRQADALLFPTLCDGFGMVATEAWSRGLPVITTPRAGAADLLQCGINGRSIPAGDTAALVKEIEWCLTHRAELAAMREGALATARGWQWADYRRALGGILAAGGLFDPQAACLSHP